MVKVENKKYVAEIGKKSSPDYVTFWGKIKGDIYKQTDLIELLNKIKTGFNSTIDGIKAKLHQLSTINDGKDTYQINKLEVEKDSEGDLQNLVINTTNNISVTLPIRDSETLVDKEDFESTVDEINERITEVENSIPTSTSQLVNDGDGESSFATQSYLEEYVNNAISSEIPTKTSDLINDGDGTSQFATQEYVSENGGKIDVIKVNGVVQPIVDKTVNITIPKSQGGSSDCVLIYGNVFVETSEGDHVEYHWDPVDSENDNLFYYILEHVQPGWSGTNYIYNNLSSLDIQLNLTYFLTSSEEEGRIYEMQTLRGFIEELTDNYCIIRINDYYRLYIGNNGDIIDNHSHEYEAPAEVPASIDI